MVNLRPATLDDLGALVTLAQAMHDESPRFSRYTFEAARLHYTLESVLEMGAKGCMVVGESDGEIVGAMVAMSFPHFACDVLQAGDIGLFIAKAHRGGTLAARLVRSYLAWAASIKAEPTISINTGVDVERTGQLFAALGAKQSGTNWTWGI
jgi:RimJ/RimL family protein N-acetyltransferase